MSGRVLSAFQKTALRAGRPRKRVVPIRDWKYFKGDTVKVMTGKARGEVGVIMALNKQKNTVAIEDVNMARKIRNGKFVKAERAVHYSNVLLLDPESGKPTRVRWEWTEEGEKVRIATKSRAMIPIPDQSKYSEVPDVKNEAKDTSMSEALKETYTPI
ncbi:hypothetical protein AAMO2058_001648800 [Amorphochlora amoebiformis]